MSRRGLSSVGRVGTALGDSLYQILVPKAFCAPFPSKRYIPVRSRDLKRVLLSTDGVSETNEREFLDVYRLAEILLRVTWLKRRDELVAQYIDFLPRNTSFYQFGLEKSSAHESRQSARLEGYEEGVAGAEEKAMLKNLHDLADHANYDKLGDEWINQALNSPDRDGVSIKPVDRSEFTTLNIWVRGRSRGSKISTRRGIEKRLMDAYDLEIRSKDADDEERFDRVLAAVRRSGDAHMRLLLFEHVPTSQIELVLPNVQVAMTLKDKIVIGVLGGIGGIVVACKTAAVAMIGSQTNVYGLALAAAVCSGVCFQTWVQFQRKMTEFNHTITENLYSRKLAQNMVVIESLIQETIEQELRELMIGYALLLNPKQGADAASLKESADSFLETNFGLRSVEFDIDDCTSKLRGLGLFESDASDEDLRVVPPKRAIATLRRLLPHLDHDQRERAS